MQSTYSVGVAPGGSLQEAPGVEVPTARATLRPYAYVGLPVDHAEESPLPPPPSYDAYSADSRIGELPGGHGDVSLGVGRDMAGAESAARRSARKDNAAFVEKKG